MNSEFYKQILKENGNCELNLKRKCSKTVTLKKAEPNKNAVEAPDVRKSTNILQLKVFYTD